MQVSYSKLVKRFDVFLTVHHSIDSFQITKFPQGSTVKYLGLQLDSKLTWREHITKKRKQIDLKTREINWLIGKNSPLSLRGELIYLTPLGSENISALYFKQCFFQGGGITLPPQTVKHHTSQSQDRNNKYFILYIEFCINNKI